MVTALAVVAALSALATLLLILLALVLVLFLRREGRTAADTADTLLDLLPASLNTFFARVGRKVIRLSALHRSAPPDRRDTRVGARLRFIGALLPKGDEWRLEEMMNHRNVLREQRGRVPSFHYLRLFLGVCTIRWETLRDPQRRVD
jgi:hypothetical protein